MKIIKTKVIGDTITPIEQGYVIENQVNQYAIEFDFDETWDFEEKYCIFQDEFEEQTFKRAIINNQVIVPSELLNGKITIQVYGQNIENDVITQRQPSLKYVFSILNSLPANASEEQSTPTPTQWELYISQIEDMCNDLKDQFDDLKEDCKQKCNDVIDRVEKAEDDIKTNANNISALTDRVSNDEELISTNTTEISNIKRDYSLITETGNKLSVSIDSNYLMTITLKDKNNNILSTASVDFPIESAIVNATYNNTTKEITFTLQNGNTLVVPIGDIISGLASQSDLESLANRVSTIEGDYLTSTDKTQLQESITDLDNEIELEQQAQDNNILALQQENERLSRIVEGLPTKQASGTSFVLNDMVKANIKDYQLRGNTIQDGTPTPDSPVAIQSATGNQEINVYGINIASSYFKTDFIARYYPKLYVEAYLKSSTTYTLSFKASASGYNLYTNENLFSSSVQNMTTTGQRQSITFTTKNAISKDNVGQHNENGWLILKNGPDNNNDITFSDIQLELGSTATDYEQYSGTTFSISLGTTELCKIGDYQDKIYKSNDKWYLEKNVGKITLNGTEEWNSMSWGDKKGYNLAIDNIKQTTSSNDSPNCISNYYRSYTQNDLYNNAINFYGISNRTNQSQIIIRNDECSNTDNFKLWLSIHNTIVYYILVTPTTTEITDTSLISQLEDIYNIILNENNTIIVNGNLPSDTLVIGYADISKLIASLSSQDNRSVVEEKKVVTKPIEEPIEEPIETKEEER